MARKILKGIAISPGIAIGPLHILPDSAIQEKRHISPGEIGDETAAIYRASAHVCETLQQSLLHLPGNLKEFREIIASQIELARDTKLLDGARARVRHKHICASWAIHETAEELYTFFASVADPYLSERAQDIKIIGKCLIAALQGSNDTGTDSINGILAAHSLSPADIVKLKVDGINGILTIEDGHTSHTAILARGLKIPALTAVDGLADEACNGEQVILDAFSGQILFAPDEYELDQYLQKKKSYEIFEHEARISAFKPAQTLDGTTICVRANLGIPDELAGVKDSGADGVGLYRTEYAYLGGRQPDEESLYQEYRTIVDGVAPQKVIFRTLDVGADKILPVQEALHEPNPALGLRGIRFCLQRKDILAMQLRAILRASHNANTALMLPMLTCMAELRQTRALIAEICASFRSHGIAHADNIPLGVLIETPAAVIIADALAAACDFISIGTNDLLHYLLAIDRNNRHVAYLHDPLHPAFIRSIKYVTDCAHKHGKKVSVCGELAADAQSIVLLLGMGVDVLSASPRFVPEIKHIVRNISAAQCTRAARFALNEINVEKTEKMLQDVLQGIVAAGASFHNQII